MDTEFQRRSDCVLIDAAIELAREECAMTFQIFVQNQPDRGYVASVIGIPNCIAKGETKDEAIDKAKEVLNRLLSQGDIVSVKIDNVPNIQTDNPWLKIAGKYKDDPTWEEFQAYIQEYRRELDAEEATREEDAQEAA
jgi:hypothetical protein